MAGQTATVDASPSTDLDGIIVTYDWLIEYEDDKYISTDGGSHTLTWEYPGWFHYINIRF